MKKGILARRKKRRPTLMLTSLLDMFTIILIFLIVSFEAEDFEFKMEEGVQLPESAARSAFKPAVNVAVSASGVRVDQLEVLTFTDGAPDPAHLAADEAPPLVEALRTVREGLEADEAAKGLPAAPRIIMLQADKALPYRTLYLVMRSARLAGFEKYRLAVMKK